MSWRAGCAILPTVGLAWLSAGSQAAAAEDELEALEQQIEEAGIELETEELDEIDLESWAEDELAEWQSLRRRATAARQRAAYGALLPRLSLSAQVGWSAARASARGTSQASPSAGAIPGPDDADRQARAGLGWLVAIRLVWDLSGLAFRADPPLAIETRSSSACSGGTGKGGARCTSN